VVRGVAKLAALALVAGVLAAPAGAHTKRHATSLNTLSRGVLAQVNAFRRSQGLVPLTLAPGLNAAAAQHSHEMAAHGYFAHSSLNGSSFDNRIARYYLPNVGYWSVGENLAWGAPDLSPQTVLQMWLNSPPHRENLMTARWRQIGVSAIHVASAPGTFGGGPATIVTVDFGVRR
jgi:uncharacterized protein YkwD